MKRLVLICLCVLGFCIAAAYSFAAGPLGVSPGGGTGDPVVGSVFPTFSWSAVEGAVGYRLEIFKGVEGAPGHEEMTERGELVMRVEIPAPALSWSLSGSEALKTGESYIWYVKAFDSDAEGQWSQGNRFRIDASVALTGMDEAVKEKVREYVRTDTELRNTIRDIREERGTEGSALAVAVGTGESPEVKTLKHLEGEDAANTFFGRDAGIHTTGESNTFIGVSAGYWNTTGHDNTFLGRDSGFSNTSGNYNSFLGMNAGYRNTSGGSNTFLGMSAGMDNEGGNDNTFVGNNAGGYNTSGNKNTFLGRSAGSSNTIGNYNSFVGCSAGNSNTTGSDNTIVGDLAANMNTEGNSNTMIGRSAGASNITGNNNTLVGWKAGYSNTGSGNLFLGYAAGYSETGSNRLYIHNSASSSPLVYGDFDTRQLMINGTLSIADLSAASDISLKKDIQPLEGALEKVASLKGVSYNWRTEEYPKKGFSRDRQIGLIAQDVEKVLPELVRTDKDGKKSLAYDKLTSVLVEAIKAQQGEIKTQQKEIAAQSVKLAKQQSELDAQATRIKELENMMRKFASKAI